MARGTFFILSIVLAYGVLWARSFWHIKGAAKAFAVTALCITLAGGYVGPAGQFGDFMEKTFYSIDSKANHLSVQVVGGSMMWIVWFAISFMMIMGVLPNKMCSYQLRPWQIWSGLFVPMGVVAVPGVAGWLLSNILGLLGGAGSAGIHGLFD